MNKSIRKDILNYIMANGQQDTRIVIDVFSKRYQTAKQRISGNLSYMKRTKQITIVPNKPHSIML